MKALFEVDDIRVIPADDIVARVLIVFAIAVPFIGPAELALA